MAWNEGHQSTSGLLALGYLPHQITELDALIAKPAGSTMFGGRAGSGKTIGLCSLLRRRVNQNLGGIKAISVQHPREIIVDGVTELPVVHRGEGSPISDGVSDAMRADPDVIMIGEVNDGDSAQALLRAAGSGHQVVTTVHAQSAIEIIKRLRSLGVPNDVLGSRDFISGLVYQVLCPVLCSHCSLSVKKVKQLDEAQRPDLATLGLALMDSDTTASLRFKNKTGCEHCEHSGISGRSVIAEVVIVDEHMKALFSEGKDAEAAQHWANQNPGKTIRDVAVGKMKSGLMDPFDLVGRFGPLVWV